MQPFYNLRKAGARQGGETENTHHWDKNPSQNQKERRGIEEKARKKNRR